MKRLIIDIDDTICRTEDGDYASATMIAPICERLHEYRAAGFTIVLHSARNMRTYDGNIGLIVANTVPVLVDWLVRNRVPYDELHIGKPWCGFEGFYVDDKAIRPDEFASLDRDGIKALLNASRSRIRQMEKKTGLPDDGDCA